MSMLPRSLVCVVLSSLQRHSLGDVVTAIASTPTFHGNPIAILIVDTRSADNRDSIPGFLNSEVLGLEMIRIPFEGYADTRRKALEFVAKTFDCKGVVFVDDDDVPADGTLASILAHVRELPNAIIGGRVTTSADAFLSAMDQHPRNCAQPVEHVGASMMAFSSHVLPQVIRWLHSDFNWSGGEDTYLCHMARRSGMSILECQAALATTSPRQLAPDSAARLRFLEAWIYSAVVIQTSRSPRMTRLRRLMSAIRDLLWAGVRHERLPRAAGTVVGLLLPLPPPRAWAISAAIQPALRIGD